MIHTWLMEPLRLLYWYTFKHFSLAEYNQRIGIKTRANGVFSLISIKAQIAENPYLGRYVMQVIVATLLGLSIFVTLSEAVRAIIVPGIPFALSNVVIGIVCGIVIFLASAVSVGVEAGVGFGVAGGISFGLGIASSGGVESLSPTDVWSGLVAGTIFGATASLVISELYKIYDRLACLTSGGIGGGVLGGITWSLAGGVAASTILGITFCAAFCFSSGITIGSLGKRTVGVIFCILISIVSALAASILAGSESSWQLTLTVFFINIPVALVTYFRLVFYPFYVILNSILYFLMYRGSLLPFQVVALSPHQLDELIWLPLPFLDKQLIALVQADRQIGLRELSKVAASFHQGWAAMQAIENLASIEMGRIRNLPDLAGLTEDLSWLPAFGSKNLYESLVEVSNDLRAALTSSSRYNQLIRLNRVQMHLTRLQLTLASEPRRLAVRLGPIFASWLRLVEADISLLTTEQMTIQEIPNPYIPGLPVQASESAMFMGRLDIFAEIESSLTAKHQPPTLSLYGPRRSGKTSMLNQLPSRLQGNIIPVFVNLQELAGTVYSSYGFSTALVRTIKRQCLHHRNVELPSADSEKFSDSFKIEPYLAFGEWLNAATPFLAGHTLFITFDEFEWVENAIDRGVLDENVLSFFRNLIQHGDEPRLALLFSGVHTLDEMKYNWPSYFINVRTVKVGYLSEAETRRLITNPIPDFPLDFAPSVVDRFIYCTRNQPYLVQLVAFELVNYLNSYERRSSTEQNHMYTTATLRDLDVALEKSLMAGYNYFAEIWQNSTTSERLVLADIAASNSLPEDLQKGEVLLALRKLVKREIIENVGDEYHIQIPLVNRWIAEEKPAELVRSGELKLSAEGMVA